MRRDCRPRRPWPISAKGYNITWNWYEQLTDAHARAFTVAKAARMDVLTTLRTEVDRAIHDGITRDEFINTLTPRLQSSVGGASKSRSIARATPKRSSSAARAGWR